MNSEVLRFVVKAKDEASRTLKGVGGSFGALGKVAKIGMAVAAAAVTLLIAAIGALIGFIFKAKKVYEDWMVNLAKTQRLTGMTAEGVSILAAQLRLSGVDASRAQAALGLFAKSLDAARQGAAANVATFERLGVELRNADGSLRPLDEVLADARDRLSEVDDAATRAGLAAKLFGRGFSSLGPWLTKSTEKIREYAKFTKDLGMVMSEQAMKAFGAYRENQRKLAFAWDAVKISAYAALVPLINKLMPSVISLIQRGAKWLGDFRVLVEKKGWGVAFEQMIPGGRKVIGLLGQARDWWNRNKVAVKDVLVVVGNVFRKIGQVGAWCARNKTLMSAVWDGMKASLLRVLGPLGDVYRTLSAIKGAMEWAIAHGDAAGKAVRAAGAGSGGGKGYGAGRDGARGAAVFAPASGQPWTLHGRETVVAHKDPSRGLEDLAKSGIIGGADVPTISIDARGALFAQDAAEVIADLAARGYAVQMRRATRTSGVFA